MKTNTFVILSNGDWEYGPTDGGLYTTIEINPHGKVHKALKRCSQVWNIQGEDFFACQTEEDVLQVLIDEYDYNPETGEIN